VEREGFPIANLVKKAEEDKMDAAPVFTDVKAFPYRKFRGCVDILSAGFPCQPFSSAGKRQATEDPRHLYPWIAEGITACNPTVVILENVEGIISAKTGNEESVLKYVLRDLEERGFKTSWGIFSAEEVGAPHQRKRVFIVAHAKDGQSRQSETRHGREGIVGRSEEVGDTSSVGSCRGSEDESRQRSEMFGTRSESTYPARPGEEQYEWEPSRTTESRLGRGDDGSSDRIDRLRLLGNGVVPDTCALAFRTLYGSIHS
jgi:DNA (cytosine-5)-methyltransferase 1